jgi:sulfatase maturation enzyme AslB (radical SAM superfamily)
MSLPSRVFSKSVCQIVGGALDAVRQRFPPVVRIETTNACNARCVICPHREMRRSITAIDERVYARLIDQCAAGGCREVHLHNFGEPLLDKRLEDRIAYAKQKGIGKVKIFSNGSLLTAERARRLIEAGLDEFKVSFDGANSEEFEQIRAPLRFDAVVGNVVELVKQRNAARSKLRVHVACCSTTDKQSTMRSLEKVVDQFAFGKLHNWGGHSALKKRVRKPCSRLWRTFTVLASGEVSLCCLDYEGEQPLGRVDDSHSIRDIWNGQPYRDIRRLHRESRQGQIPLCANCTKSFL